MIKKLLNIRRELVYQDLDSQRFYSRIVGGMAWPAGMLPGHAVVLAEEGKKNVGFQEQKLYLLAEKEGGSIEELMQAMYDLRHVYACERWLGDTSEEGCMAIFRHNMNRQPADNRIALTRAPLAGEKVQVHIQQVFEVLQKDRKLLVLGEGQITAQAIRTVRPEDLRRPVAEFPALAALGYALADMLLRRGVGYRKLPKVEYEFNPFEMKGIK